MDHEKQNNKEDPLNESIKNLVPEYDYPLVEPYEFLAFTPGKGIRSKLVIAFQKWLQVRKEDLIAVVKIIQMLHNASLMIDDIEDNSKLRRGVPVVHSIYGLPATINCANYIYFLALDLCHKLNNPLAVKGFVEELINLHRGQGREIYWRDNSICPTEGEYDKMVLDKTGGLFRLAIKLMQAFSDNKRDFLPLVDAIALHFQIMDDYINLQSGSYMKNKSFCEDLTEGKFSFPIIHSIRSTPRDHVLINILKQRTEDPSLKNLL